MSINVHLRRLTALQEKCGGNPNKKKEEDTVDTSKMSAYEQQQYKIAVDMRRTRETMAEIEALPSGASVDKRARLNNQVRGAVSKMVAETKELRHLATKENRKEEYLQLVSHVNKTERLSKGRNPNATDEDGGGYSPANARGVTRLEDVEMGGMGGGGGGGGPSIREDPEFAQFFEQTKRNDEKMDQQLDRIGAGVLRLKQNATLISDELQIQKALLDETEHKVDNIHGKLRGLNRKLKETLKKVDQDRLCIYLFCCLLLLGIAGGCFYIFYFRKSD